MTTVASIFRSRTILLNLLALTYALVQAHGIAVPAVDPTVLAVLTAVVNVGMRFLTKTPLVPAPARG